MRNIASMHVIECNYRIADGKINDNTIVIYYRHVPLNK